MERLGVTTQRANFRCPFRACFDLEPGLQLRAKAAVNCPNWMRDTPTHSLTCSNACAIGGQRLRNCELNLKGLDTVANRAYVRMVASVHEPKIGWASHV
jgi:hypothetical protein